MVKDGMTDLGQGEDARRGVAKSDRVWYEWSRKRRGNESRRMVKDGMTSLGQVENEVEGALKNGRVW